MNALKTAGIKVDPQKAFAALQSMGGEGFGRADTDFKDPFKTGGEGEGEGKGGNGKGGNKV